MSVAIWKYSSAQNTCIYIYIQTCTCSALSSAPRCRIPVRFSVYRLPGIWQRILHQAFGSSYDLQCILHRASGFQSFCDLFVLHWASGYPRVSSSSAPGFRVPFNSPCILPGPQIPTYFVLCSAPGLRILRLFAMYSAPVLQIPKRFAVYSARSLRIPMYSIGYSAPRLRAVTRFAKYSAFQLVAH